MLCCGARWCAQVDRNNLMVHVFFYCNGLHGEVGDLMVLVRRARAALSDLPEMSPVCVACVCMYVVRLSRLFRFCLLLLALRGGLGGPAMPAQPKSQTAVIGRGALQDLFREEQLPGSLFFGGAQVPKSRARGLI